MIASVLYSLMQASATYANMGSSPSTEGIWLLVFLFSTVVWADRDRKNNDFSGVFDFGAYMYFAWPVALPYYLIRTRGLKGLVIYLGFWGLYLVPYIAGAFVYVLLF